MKIADIILFCIGFSVAWVVLFYWIPFMSQKASLYGLHNLRDRIYAVGASFPNAQHTLIYRDIEFILTTNIHIVRDLGYRKTLEFFSARRRSTPKRENMWRKEKYNKERLEIFSNEDGQQALDELFSVFHAIDGNLYVYLVAGHPLVAVFIVASIFIASTFILIEASRPSSGVTNTIIKRIEAIQPKRLVSPA